MTDPFIDRPAVKAAALSSVRTFRQFAHRYRRWAFEERAKGNETGFERYRSEANRYWHLAKSYIETARTYSNG